MRFTANQGSTNRFQVAEIQMFDGGGSGGDPERTEGGAASGSGTPCNTATETVAAAYDNRMTSGDFSKWCVTSAPSTGSPISTVYNFAGTTAFAVTRYTITTGNDVPTRDPRDWTFQGCLDGSCTVDSPTGWVTLDTRTSQFAGADHQLVAIDRES